MTRITSYNDLLNATPEQIMEDWLDHIQELDPTLCDRSPYTFNSIFAEAIATQFWIFIQLLKQKVKDSNILTAEGTALDEIVKDRLPNGRLPGTPAQASVIFTRGFASEEPLPIPKGTRVAARSENGPLLIYQTTEDVEIAPNETWVRANVVSDTAGVRYNVYTGEINIILSGIPGIVSVTNDSPAYGGTDMESDESLRTRALNVIWSTGKATVPILETRLTSIEGVHEAKTSPLGEGDLLVVVDGVYETIANKVYTTLYENVAAGVTCPGVLAAKLRSSGNMYSIGDTSGADIWVRARENIVSEVEFVITYIDQQGAAKTATVYIPPYTPKGYMVKAVRMAGPATSVTGSTYEDVYDLDVFLGWGSYPYLWVQPELQPANISLDITLTNTPEPDLISNIQKSLSACLDDYRIGEKLEYADVVKYIYVDYSTGRAFRGIDNINSFTISCKSIDIDSFGESIEIEKDERVRAGTINIVES